MFWLFRYNINFLTPFAAMCLPGMFSMLFLIKKNSQYLSMRGYPGDQAYDLLSQDLVFTSPHRLLHGKIWLLFLNTLRL